MALSLGNTYSFPVLDATAFKAVEGQEAELPRRKKKNRNRTTEQDRRHRPHKAKPPTGQGQPRCDFCGKAGHTADECWHAPK